MVAPMQGDRARDDRFVKREVDLAFSKEEEAVNDALMKAMAVPREAFYSLTAQPTPRYGFVKHEMGIRDVLDTARKPGGDRRMDYSGSYGSYSGTSRPGIGSL